MKLPDAEKTQAANTGGEILSALYEKLDSIDRRLAGGQAPATWSIEDIGEWLALSKYTTHQRVVTRPGFPEPIVPAGVHGGQKRWFADEVIEWFRRNRGSLPKARSVSGRSRGRPRGVQNVKTVKAGTE